jgi:hypothetical protein
MLKRLVQLICVVSILTSMGIFYVAGQVEPIMVSYNIRTTEKNIASEYDHFKNHRFRVASLKSPSRLETQMASAQLELVPVREVKILKFSPTKMPLPKPRSVTNLEAPVRGGFLSVREAQAKTDND